MALTNKLTAIANAIRNKTGLSGQLTLGEMVSEINRLHMPSGTKSITSNGTVDVTDYASANVNVPIPSGYIVPSGSKSITSNGTVDVTQYASANVNVPVPSGYIIPSGTKSITENGTVDVTQYASANVNVPVPSGYIKPSGSTTITSNGTVDVTQYASAIINVPSSGGGISGVTELYSSDSVSITYTSTTAGTAKTITGISGLCTYPMVVVIIENANTTASTLKFIRSVTAIGNISYASGGVSVTRYGTQHYYTSGGALANLASTSYGLWGYTISTSSSGTLTIRGRCNGSYYTTLTGTYKVRVLGVNF